MILSDDFSQLDHLLQESGASGHQLRLYLLRHFSDLVRHLTSNLDIDAVLRFPNEAATASSPVEPQSDPAEESPALVPSELACPEYGDEAALHRVRTEALEVFEHRRFDQQSYVVLWMDVQQLWGHPFFLCMAATTEGYRHILGFVETVARDHDAMASLFQGFLDRGLCAENGLLCITPAIPTLSRVLTDCFGPRIQFQHCQVHKRERVVSYLPDTDRLRIRGAICRAYEIPELARARTALMQIHAQLIASNHSAAHWLLRDLDATLTLHRSGVYEQLSSSLRSTRCVTNVVRQLSKRLRGIRPWLPPPQRRAQFALLLLEMERPMRRLAHAAYLSPMQSALFAEETS